MAEGEILTPEQWEQAKRIASIFMPYAMAKVAERYPDSTARAKFAHYTSAEAALKIIESKHLWLRNPMCMSDYREMTHGYDALRGAFLENEKKGVLELGSVLEAIAPQKLPEVINAFDRLWPEMQAKTFVASLSEHDESREAELGRLSMWRAYGQGAARVAIVVSVPLHSTSSQRLRFIFSPVAYVTDAEVAGQLDVIINNVRRETEFLRTVPVEIITGTLFIMLVAAVCCSKHSGFLEEREWRAIYGVPHYQSAVMEATRAVRVIEGVPQVIYSLPLDANAVPEVGDLDFKKIFDRVIIGPTQYPVAMYNAFVEKLEQAGVPDARERVVTSKIPLRT